MLVIADLIFIFFYWPAPAPNPRRLSVTARILECDLVGGTLFAFALTPPLLGLIWGGEVSGNHTLQL